MVSPFSNRNRILENKLCYVIEDAFPVSKGHCLVIPRREYADYFNSSEAEKKDLWALVDETKNYLEKKYSPDGFNIGINCGESAGQTVMHMHIHVIPRYHGDTENPRGGVRGVIPHKQSY